MAFAADIAFGAEPARGAADGSKANVDDLARRAAFGRLVRQDGPSALGVARRLLGEASAAEDLVQEAFLRAWRDLPKLAPGRDVRPWFYRILINAGRDRLRRRAVRVRATLSPRKPMPGGRPTPSPLSSALGRDLLARVDRAVEKLPLRQRECLLLRSRASLSYRDMAELLDISEGVVKGHLVAARRALLARFGKEISEWGVLQ